jgi:hypothetical protein
LTPHLHTGFFAFLFAGASAVIFIKLAKIASAKMSASASFEAPGRWLAGVLE